MTIAIEPMITVGTPDVYVHADGWSISTDDGSLAAHFEHTVAITEGGPQDPDAPGRDRHGKGEFATVSGPRFGIVSPCCRFCFFD